MANLLNVTQYNKSYTLSTFEEKNEIFALSNRIFNKLSNETKFVKIEGILSEIQHLQSLYFLLFSLYFAHHFVHYLRINLADTMYLCCIGSQIYITPHNVSTCRTSLSYIV